MVVKYKGKCYIFEFKVVDSAEGKALEQIKQKGYHEKYRGRCKEIYLIGVEFSKKERNITSFEYERA